MVKRIGRYELVSRLGRGGMGEVFRARLDGAEGFTKDVALKRIPLNITEEPILRDLFVREAKLTVALEHPNIVQVFELGEHDGQLFIAMELNRGITLPDLIQHYGGKVPSQIVAVIAFDLLEALDFAHRFEDASGEPTPIVHRDVSPENVLIGKNGFAKLCDFGVAMATPKNSEGDPLKGHLIGKVNYMSPEQARGEDLDERTDIYSLGASLFKALTGRSALGEYNSAAMYMKAAGTEPRDLSRLIGVAPIPMKQIIGRAMEPHPEDRFPNAALAREELERYILSFDARSRRAEIAQIAGTLAPPDPKVIPSGPSAPMDPNEEKTTVDEPVSPRWKSLMAELDEAENQAITIVKDVSPIPVDVLNALDMAVIDANNNGHADPGERIFVVDNGALRAVDFEVAQTLVHKAREEGKLPG